MLSAPRRRVLAELQLILISPVLPSLTCIVETFMASLKVALNPSAKIERLSEEIAVLLSRVKETNLGAKVSIVKELILRLSLEFPAKSVTEILQLL